jgi:hypothetical protein
MTDELNQIIENQVRSKVLELSTWKQVRWEGGRLYYEATRISNEIADYDTETRILYLECLLSKNYIIQDNLPSSAPDITLDFKNWLTKTISKLKIKKIQDDKNLLIRKVLNKQKKRPAIPYKIKSLLQKEVNSTCPFCTNEDVDHFQIHHIDENPENNKFENLLMVCANCHSKITKGDISQTNVLEKKQDLISLKIK